MPRRARIHYVSLKSSLVNLPISVYGPLLEKSIRPQNLAVHLKLDSPNASAKVEAYVGWTGMASASSLAHFNSSDTKERGFETVEIDPQYAQGLGLAQDDLVELGLLHDLPIASSVATEPLTSDDWEIIEIHASHVESTLLSQVRVAKIGQEIDVWVLGRTRVRLRVVSLFPTSKTNALLLGTDTEVSIAPKARGKRRDAQKITPVNDPTTTGSTSTSVSGKKALDTPNFPSHILRVLPARLLSPLCPPSLSYEQPESLAYVSPFTFAALVKAPYPLPVELHGIYYKASYHRLAPPADPTDGQKRPESVDLRSTEARGANVSEKDQEHSRVHSVPKNALFVGWSREILESHIVFPKSLDGVNDWDLIRVTCEQERESEKNIFSTSQESVKLEKSESQTSSPNSGYLIGVDDILSRCIKFCISSYIVHASKNHAKGVSGLLITGRSRTGKTSVAKVIGDKIEADSRSYSYIHYVDFANYVEKSVQTLKTLFRFWFEKAAWHRPSVLIFDNIDKLLSAEVEHADSFRARHITELFVALYSASARVAPSNFAGILLIATSESETSLHSLLNTKHIFQEVVQLQTPNKDARRDILANLVQRRLGSALNLAVDSSSPPNFTLLATQTEGYSPSDLEDFVSRAVHQAAIRKLESNGDPGKTSLSAADFEVAQVDFVPLSLRDVKTQKSDVQWVDIGGLGKVKRILRETLEWPTKYAQVFAQSPLRLRSGLLLYGYPGCGKTLLASAVAKECGLNFISVKGPELLNKYIGASEKSVRDIFERASSAKPCVLFFDEFDSIAPKRGHDSTGVTDRVVNQMLTQMDGAEGLEGVYVLAATSRPDLIDSALLRPGRLDKSLLCDMPNFEDRKDILRAVGRKISLAESVDLNEIAEATEMFSGADLQALVYNAHLAVIQASLSEMSTVNRSSFSTDQEPIEYTAFGGSEQQTTVSRAEKAAIERRLRQIQSSNQQPDSEKSPQQIRKNIHQVTQEDLRRALKSTHASVSSEERHRLERIYQAFSSDRGGPDSFPVPPSAGGVGGRASLM